jgi:Fe-S cluster biogenesis protein NfuA
MEQGAIAQAVDELRALVTGDGADLEIVAADDASRRVELRLDMSQVTCEECVLPPELLESMIIESLRRRVPDLDQIVVDDPRRSPAPTD